MSKARSRGHAPLTSTRKEPAAPNSPGRALCPMAGDRAQIACRRSTPRAYAPSADQPQKTPCPYSRWPALCRRGAPAAALRPDADQSRDLVSQPGKCHRKPQQRPAERGHRRQLPSSRTRPGSLRLLPPLQVRGSLVTVVRHSRSLAAPAVISCTMTATYRVATATGDSLRHK